MTEKKKKTLVELTEKEFVGMIFNTTESYDRDIWDIKEKQKEFFKLYRQYTYDKNKYKLKFILENGSILRYEKTKPVVGFRYGNKK
jgi:hypothetical protein